MNELGKGVKGILPLLGLSLRLFLFLIPVGFLGWAGFRKVRPVVKGIKKGKDAVVGKNKKKRKDGKPASADPNPSGMRMFRKGG